MRALALIVLALCFVSVSALSGYEKASADIAKDDGKISALATLLDDERYSATGEPIGIDNQESANVECPCKKTSGALTLACGITLALSTDDLGGWLSGTKQSWSAIASTDRDTQMMYLLKRPPRPIL